MNRAQRRRKERLIKKNTGLEIKEIRKIKEDATDIAFNRVFSCLYTLPLEILNKDYGFGKKRLQKFNDKLIDMLKEVEQGDRDLATMEKRMKDEFNIIYRNGEMD